MIASDSVDVRVLASADLSPAEYETVHRLFDLAYSQANHAYLDKSLGTMGYVALGSVDGDAIGFAVGDRIESDLPGLEGAQVVSLAGICCIVPQFRRMGLFQRLSGLAGAASGLPIEGRPVLLCGRMAHPASFRIMLRHPTYIPKLGVPITPLQREIGLKVASLYRVTIDPETLVVIGDGTPIGYSNIDQVATEEEWAPFAKVNRDRGDSLLSMAWIPVAPRGW